MYILFQSYPCLVKFDMSQMSPQQGKTFIIFPPVLKTLTIWIAREEPWSWEIGGELIEVPIFFY